MPTLELKPQRITIRDLPAEIISQIVLEVDHLVSEGRNLKECPRHRPLGLPPDDDDGERCSRWAMRDSRRNDSSAAAGEGDERIYPDKRPTDPLLPLLFISRPFLYAARKLLYRRVHVSGPYQAHLLLRSLADDQLASCVRTLSLDLKEDVSLGRGGGQLYIDLIEKTGPNLESLTIRPGFLQSAFWSYKRCSITTARILAIQRTSPELEELTVHGLERAGVVNESEEAAMWEEANAEADETDGGGGGKSERRGLKTLILDDFPVPHAELNLILCNSQQTLTKLHLRHPDHEFSRVGLASTLLIYGANLTELELVLPNGWSYRYRRHSELPFPLRPKDYQNGKPQDELLSQIAKYPHIVDAIMPYLPNLKTLKLEGPQASTNVFSYFPPSLRTLSLARCWTIEAAALAQLLCKPVITRADGTEIDPEDQTVPAEGLACITYEDCEWDWTDDEVDLVVAAATERDICFHFSSEEWRFCSGLHGRLAGLG
ncbi:hypothetical protein JCM1840_007654 [Sporobolomyces johnsonii]